MRRVTRDDVARRARVSPAVVSFVVNNGPRPVAASTRERVLAAIAELGYRPNLVARALRSTRSNTIGLIVPDSGEPYFTELVRAVERATFAQGSLVLLGNSGFSAERERQYAESLSNMRVDGLLLVPAEVDDRNGHPIPDVDVPVVYLNGQPPAGAQAPSVRLDDVGGGRAITDHLLTHGYREVGCLTGQAHTGPVADRARGCLEALSSAGLAPTRVLRTGLDRHSTKREVTAWLEGPQRPQAIVAAADGLAIDVLTVAHELGLRVPTDLAVVGFGATAPAAHSWPTLTTIGRSFDDLATAAVSSLLTSRDSHVLDVHLIPRASCGCAEGRSS
ncbi:LacI family DNA-binding transcriptional regulator [Saxibacter everestensis]|uniref:LacI family DNA-binding transcriptional regulator n=1 Tax=Saxibacter everestensis TaxID=2909229 RepID=A0ABY8QSW5_9MICO|nr:LacI family DNA-binding transcriptional regulator [Brevibacteriaceae bacterium ZFBP1038]